MIGLIETMHLGEKLGMEPKLLADILNSASGRSWASEVYNPVPGVTPTAPASREYKDGFGVKLMAKDMGLAMDAAKEVGCMTLLGAVSQQLYSHVGSRKGYEKLDFSSVYKFVKENSK
jgi:3-hydroxyisobutyrate dehydrogenase